MKEDFYWAVEAVSVFEGYIIRILSDIQSKLLRYLFTELVTELYSITAQRLEMRWGCLQVVSHCICTLPAPLGETSVVQRQSNIFFFFFYNLGLFKHNKN